MQRSLARTLFAAVILALLASCNGGTSFQPASLESSSAPKTTIHQTGRRAYDFSLFGSLGGTIGVVNGINNREWASGFASLPGDQTVDAALWKNPGSVIDLGTLGGPNSFNLFPQKNGRGLIAGLSETAEYDPYGEQFCSNRCILWLRSDPKWRV